jgi:Fibronectin type III domain/A nuclease of the HNH/ENDO VII superfamily with conserved WHH
MQNSTIKTLFNPFILRGVLLMSFVMTLFMAAAQQYPVVGTMQIQSPVPTNWSSFTQPKTPSRFTLNLTLVDAEAGARNIRLKMYIEKGNTLIATSTDVLANAASLSLVPNVPQTLTDIQIAPYFQFNNLQGFSQNQYDKQLEDGLYRISFEVYDASSNQRLSAAIGQNFFITLNTPPALSQPANAEQIPNAATNIAFQWLNQAATLVTGAQYQFTLVEVPQGTLDLVALFNVPLPKYKTTVAYTANVLSVSKTTLGLVAGKTYAWRVQVMNTLGIVGPHPSFKNSGYSDIFTFTYAAATNTCPAVTKLKLKANASDLVEVSWTGSNLHYAYRVAYRKYSTTEVWQWVEIPTINTSINLTGLDAATNYEVRVGGVCGANQVSYCLPEQVKTLAAGQIRGLNCGMPDIQPPTGTPIASLLIGDVITAGDFPVTLTYVQGSNGNFSGQGWITVPWMANVKVKVVFSNIGVNTSKKLTSGTIETVYDPSWANVLSLEGNPNSESNIEKIVGIIYDCSLQLDDLQALIASGNTQGITIWIANNRDLFNNMVNYLSATNSQSNASQERLIRIQELVNLLVGQGATPNAANAQELARLLEEERVSRLLGAGMPPDQGAPLIVPAARMVTSARAPFPSNLWVTPAGTPFKMPEGANPFPGLKYCYWDLDKIIPAGALLGFQMGTKIYAASFSKNATNQYEFLGYYDLDAWRQANEANETMRYIPDPIDVVFGMTGNRGTINLVTLVTAGENTTIKYDFADLTFSTVKAVSLKDLNTHNRALPSFIIPGGTALTSHSQETVVLYCRERLGDGSVVLINNTHGKISTYNVQKLFENLKFRGIKIGSEGVYFSTIIIADGDGTGWSSLLQGIVTANPKERVLYLRFDALNKLAQADDAFGTATSKSAELSLHAITAIFKKKILANTNELKAPLEYLAQLFKGLGDVIDHAKISEKYYNPNYTEGGTNKYESWLYDVWAITKPPQLINASIRDMLEIAPGINGKIDATNTLNLVEFAFHCGLWNGIIDQIALLAGSAALVVDGQEMVHKFVFNLKDQPEDPLGIRDKFLEQVEKFQLKVKTEGGYTKLVGKFISNKIALNNATQNGELYGEVVSNVATFVLSFTKIGKASKVLNSFNELDAFGHVLSLGFKATGYLAQKTGAAIKIGADFVGNQIKLVIKVIGVNGEELSDVIWKTFISNIGGKPSRIAVAFAGSIGNGPTVPSVLDELSRLQFSRALNNGTPLPPTPKGPMVVAASPTNPTNPTDSKQAVAGIIDDVQEKLTNIRLQLKNSLDASKIENLINDFESNTDILDKFVSGELDVKVWEKFIPMGPTKEWVRKSEAIQKRIKEKGFTLADVDKLKTYYDGHLSKADVKTYPNTSSTGQYYDDFGHPDFTKDVKKIRKLDGTQERPVYEPPAGITGDRTQDAKKANEWAKNNFHADDFKYDIGSNECRIKDPNTGNWVDHTWHHHQDGKTMMAVPKEIHRSANASHIGGVQAKNAGIIGFFESPIFSN